MYADVERAPRQHLMLSFQKKEKEKEHQAKPWISVETYISIYMQRKRYARSNPMKLTTVITSGKESMAEGI